MQTDTYVKLNSIKRNEKKYIRRKILLKQKLKYHVIILLNVFRINLVVLRICNR
jgi:hypothetical protein